MDAKKSALIKLIVVESIVSIVFSVVLNFLWPSLILFFGYSIIHGVSVASYKKIFSSHLIFVCVNFVFLFICSYIKIILTPGPLLVGPLSFAALFSIVLSVISLVPALIVKFLIVLTAEKND